MTSDEADKLIVYRCEACGKLELRRAPRPGNTCPECGKEGFAQVPVEGGAIGYSVADRRHGPSIEDGRLGRMAYFAGWMRFPQIAACLQRQKAVAKGGKPAPKFGEVAVEENFLAEPQVHALLRVQVIHKGPKSQDLSFGAIAVRENHITQEQLDECLQLQKNLLQKHLEAPVLGILLAEKKYLTSDQVKSVLEIQAEHGQGPLVKLKARAPAAEPKEPAVAAAAVAEEAVAEAVSAAELTKKRILCRCGACGKTEVRASCADEDICPKCGSKDFAPVPIVGEGADPALAEAGPGPAIQDGRIGRMAYFAEWMTRQQVDACLKLQEEAVRRGEPKPRFGEVAVREGYLSELDLNALLRIQSIQQPSTDERAFGAVAVRISIISQDQLDDCLAEQKRLLRENNRAPTLGLLMSDKGLLTDKQVKAILEFQARSGGGLLSELEAARAAAAARPLGGFFDLPKDKKKLWAAGVSLAVILFSAAALATGWFGAMGWQPPTVIAGCRYCGEVVEVSAAAKTRTCPKCQRAHALCPLVQCRECGRVFLYGPYGAGTKCPDLECRAGDPTPVKSIAEVKAAWEPPAAAPPDLHEKADVEEE